MFSLLLFLVKADLKLCFYENDETLCPTSSYDATFSAKEEAEFAKYNFQDAKEVYLYIASNMTYSFKTEKFSSIKAIFRPVSSVDERLTINFTITSSTAASEIDISGFTVYYSNALKVDKMTISNSILIPTDENALIKGGSSLETDLDSVSSNYVIFDEIYLHIGLIQRAFNATAQTSFVSKFVYIDEITEKEMQIVQFGNRIFFNNTIRPCASTVALLGYDDKRTCDMEIRLVNSDSVHFYSLFGNAELAFKKLDLYVENTTMSVERDMWTGYEDISVHVKNSTIQFYSSNAPLKFVEVGDNTAIYFIAESNRLIKPITTSMLNSFAIYLESDLTIDEIIIDGNGHETTFNVVNDNEVVVRPLVISVDESLKNTDLGYKMIGNALISLPEKSPNKVNIALQAVILEEGKHSEITFSKYDITTFTIGEIKRNTSSKYPLHMVYEGDVNDITKNEDGFFIYNSLFEVINDGATLSSSFFQIKFPQEKRYLFDGTSAFLLQNANEKEVEFKRNSVDGFKNNAFAFCVSSSGIDDCGFDDPSRKKTITDLVKDIETNNVGSKLEVGTTAADEGDGITINLLKGKRVVDLVLRGTKEQMQTFIISPGSTQFIRSLDAKDCTVKFNIYASQQLNLTLLKLNNVRISKSDASFLDLQFTDEVITDLDSFEYLGGLLTPKKLFISGVSTLSINENTISPTINTNSTTKEFVFDGVNSIEAYSPTVGFPNAKVTVICRDSVLNISNDVSLIPSFDLSLYTTEPSTTVSINSSSRKTYDFTGKIINGTLDFVVNDNTGVLGNTFLSQQSSVNIKSDNGVFIIEDCIIDGNVNISSLAASHSLIVNGTNTYAHIDQLTVVDPIFWFDLNFSLPMMPLVRINKYNMKIDTILGSIYDIPTGAEKIAFRYRNSTTLYGFLDTTFQYSGLPMICFENGIDCEIFSNYASAFDDESNITYNMKCEKYGRKGEMCMILSPDPNRTWVRPVYVQDINDDLLAATLVIAVSCVYFGVVIVVPFVIVLYNCCCKARSNADYVKDVEDSFNNTSSDEYDYYTTDDSGTGLLNNASKLDGNHSSSDEV